MAATWVQVELAGMAAALSQPPLPAWRRSLPAPVMRRLKPSGMPSAPRETIVCHSALRGVVGLIQAATLSVVFAVLDLSTEIVLVVVGGIFLVVLADALHPFFLHQIHWGVAPSPLNFVRGAAVAMVAYTGVETISNLSEEARSPERTVPRSYGAMIFAVLDLFIGISVVAMSALPVHLVTGNPM